MAFRQRQSGITLLLDYAHGHVFFHRHRVIHLTGYSGGARKRFDWLGVAISGLLTAVGGGVLRDVLIQRTPRILYQNDNTLWVIAATLALAWACA